MLLCPPGGLQGDNYSERFKVWGSRELATRTMVITRVKRISDVTGSAGVGNRIQNKLWFFASARDFEPINTVPQHVPGRYGTRFRMTTTFGTPC